MYSGRGGPQQNQLPPNQGQPNQQAQFMANGQPMRGNFPSSAPMNQQQPASTGYGSNVSSWDQYFGTSTNSSASNNNMTNNNAMKPSPMNNASMYGSTGNNMAMNSNSFPNNNFNPMMSNPMNNANMNNSNFNANNNSMMYSNNNANMMSSVQRGQEYDPYANSNSGYNNNLSTNVNNLPNNSNNNNPVASAIAEAAAKAFLMRTAGGGNSNVPTNNMNNNNMNNNTMNMNNNMNNPNMNMMNMNPNMGSARPNPMPTNMNMNMNANNNNMSNNNNMMMMKNAGYMNNNNNMNSMNMNLMTNSNNNAFQNNNNMPPNFNNNNMNLMNNNNNAMLMNMNAMNNNLNSNKPKTRWSAGLENPLQFPNTFAKQNKPSALFVASLLRHQQYHQQQQQQQQGGAVSGGVSAAYNPSVGGNLPYLEDVNSGVNGGVIGFSSTPAVPVAALLPPEIAPLAAVVLQQQAQQQGVKRDRDTRDTGRDTRDRGDGVRDSSVSRHGRSVSPAGGRSSGRSNNNTNTASSSSSSSRARHGGSRVSRSRSPPISRHTGSSTSSSGRSHYSSSSGTTSTSVALPHTTSSSSTSVSTIDALIKHHHFAAFHCVPTVSHTHHTNGAQSFSPLDIHWRLPQLFQPASFASLSVFAATSAAASETTGTHPGHIPHNGVTSQTTRLQDVWLSATQAVPVHYEITPPSVGDEHLLATTRVSVDNAVVQRVKYNVRVLVSFGVKEHEPLQQQQETHLPALDCHVMRKWRVLTGKPRAPDTSSHTSSHSNRHRNNNNNNNNGVSATCVLLGGEYAADCDTPLSHDTTTTATTSEETMRSLLSTARRCVLAQSLLDIMPRHTFSCDTPPLTNADGVWVFGESSEAENQCSWYKTVVIPMGIVHYNADHKGTFCAEDTPQEPEEGEEASGDEGNDNEEVEEEVPDKDTDETQEQPASKRRRVKKSDRHTAVYDEEQVALFTVLVLPLESHSSAEEEEAKFAEQYHLFATRVSGADPVAQMHQSLGQTQENMKRLLLSAEVENQEVSEAVEEVTYVVEGHRDTTSSTDANDDTANNGDTDNDNKDETAAPEDNDGAMDTTSETAAATVAAAGEPTSAQTTQSSPEKAVASVSSSSATQQNKKNVIAKPSQPTVMLAPMTNLSLRLLPMSALLSYNLSAPSDRTRDNFETALAAETLVSRFVAQGCVAWIGDVLIGHCVATHWVNNVADKVKRSHESNKPKPTDNAAASTEQETETAVEDTEEVTQMVQLWLETQWQQTFVRYLSSEFVQCVLSLVSHVYDATDGHKTKGVSSVRTFLKTKLAEHTTPSVDEEGTSAALLVERFKNACRFMDMAQDKQLSTETLRMVLLTYQTRPRCKPLSVQEIDRVVDHACAVSHVQYAKVHHGLSGKKNFFHFEYFL